MASSLSVPLSIIFVSFLYILPFVAADRAIELGGGIGGGIAGLVSQMDSENKERLILFT